MVLDLDFGLPTMISGWIEFLNGVVVRGSVLNRFKIEFRVGGLSLYTGWNIYRSSGSETLLSFGVFGSYEFVDLRFGFPQVNNIGYAR